MQVQEIMTPNPACCTPDTNLQDVAMLMVQNDCGAIPVVESANPGRLLGIVTDRDIVCREVAQGKNPLWMTAGDCMTSPITSVMPNTDLAACERIMEERQVRRIPVVDAQGTCCGIVSQADIARNTSEHETAEVVQEISQPSASSRR